MGTGMLRFAGAVKFAPGYVEQCSYKIYLF